MENHISEVIDIKKLQNLLEKFTDTTGTTGVSVLDKEGNVLVSSAWQEICSKFHRVNADSCKNCLTSDTVIASKIKNGAHYSIYKCLNGMTDVAMPIVVKDKTIGTLFIGQFLSEEPNIEFFKQQAKKFNYNEKEYLEALSKVQIISNDEVKKKIELLSEFTFFLADLGASNLDLIASKKESLKIMQKAKENEIIFKKLFEDSSDAILLLNSSGKFVEFNQATLNLLKMTKEELLLQTPASISPKYQPNGQTSEKCAEEMIDIAYQNGSHRFDWTCINANSEEFIVEVSLMPIVVKGETMLHATWSDITQRIQNEKELKKAKEQAERNELELKKAQEITHIGSWYLDIETNNVIWTTELYKMYGFDPTLPVPPYTEHMKLFTPESWETLATALENTKQTGTPYELELKTVRTDGGHGWMWVRGEAVKDTNGKTIALWGAAQDITDRKNIELELIKAKEKAERNERKFRVLFDTLPIGITLANENGQIITSNSAAERILGLSKEEQLQRSIDGVEWSIIRPDGTLMPPEEYASVRALNEQRPIFNIEMGITKEINKTAWINVNAAPIKDYGVVISYEDITERKMAENELITAKEKAEASEKQLKLIADNFVNGMIYQVAMLDENKRQFNYVSEAVNKLYGCTVKEAMENPDLIYSKLHPDDINGLLEKEKEALKNMSIFQTEARVFNPDGTIRWSYYISQPRIINGIVCWDGLEIDLTDRKEIELELIKAKDDAQKSEAQFRSLFENMDEGFAIHEMIYDINNKPIDYRFVNLNKGFEKLTGLKKVDLLGKTIKEIMPNIEQVWIDNYGNVAKTGTPFHFENYSQELDKHYNVVAYSPKKDFFAVIFSDVTQVKKFQNELITAKEKAELNEARLIDAQSVAKVGNWETNLETMEVVWSKETYNIFELDEEDFKNSHPSFLNYVHPDDIERIEAAFAESFSSKNYHSVQHRIITPSKTIKHVQEQWRIIHDKNNKPIKAFGTCQDITKIKQFESELIKAKDKAEESDRLKSAFLANMSHEIRTPMNGILGFSELLKNPNLTGEKQQDYIKIIEKSGNRMLNIINDIIDISKIEAGLMKVHKTKTCINEKIDFIYKFFKPQVEEKGMQLKLNSPSTTQEIFIDTDSEKFYSILTNLVKNALKYSDEGEIEIGYYIKDETLEFYVKDTGIGIPKNRQSAVFERFIQADILDKLAIQGAGLGLSISKAYVEMLGGKIWVESEIGIGSTFYFKLPYTSKTKTNLNNDSLLKVEDYNTDKQKLKILITEDDETSELLISIMVETISKEILIAKNGKEAIEICKNNTDIDLVLMDIQMPEMNGYETTKQIREFNKKIVIIAQTAFGLSGDKEKALKAGCNDYISKPIKKSELLLLIHKYLM
ncbi:PAS domain S-box protein [Lutibacter sp. HS1-25]|uniref:PAS domain S-box protein n=1 Tax=Lutibacter sp. HS1-25 TaxID=2485000 RepID=UPI00101354F7|nr:PAS domain S-box protein [Lutibacter sp. HS1-25]RXP44783.1 PAS domain S-box protein [Lutibacter sp. HS1-25]